MRTAHVRAGWTLTAAAILGITRNAPAQTDAHPSTAVPPRAPAQAAPATPVAEAAARLAEMRAELAWLGDTLTFPYVLAARVEGGKLEVGGEVPSAFVQQRALQLAREQGGLPVVDKLLITRDAAQPPGRVGEATLCRSAVSSLTHSFPQHAVNFQIQAAANGQLSVSGTVPSYEEKLAVSRCLSQLHGVSRVENHLTLATVLHDGKPHVRVSTDGRQLVTDKIVPAADIAVVPGPAPLVKPVPPTAAARPITPPAAPTVAARASTPPPTPTVVPATVARPVTPSAAATVAARPGVPQVSPAPASAPSPSTVVSGPPKPAGPSATTTPATPVASSPSRTPASTGTAPASAPAVAPRPSPYGGTAVAQIQPSAAAKPWPPTQTVAQVPAPRPSSASGTEKPAAVPAMTANSGPIVHTAATEQRLSPYGGTAAPIRIQASSVVKPVPATQTASVSPPPRLYAATGTEQSLSPKTVDKSTAGNGPILQTSATVPASPAVAASAPVASAPRPAPMSGGAGTLMTSLAPQPFHPSPSSIQTATPIPVTAGNTLPKGIQSVNLSTGATLNWPATVPVLSMTPSTGSGSSSAVATGPTLPGPGNPSTGGVGNVNPTVPPARVQTVASPVAPVVATPAVSTAAAVPSAGTFYPPVRPVQAPVVVSQTASRAPTAPSQPAKPCSCTANPAPAVASVPAAPARPAIVQTCYTSTEPALPVAGPAVAPAPPPAPPVVAAGPSIVELNRQPAPRTASTASQPRVPTVAPPTLPAAVTATAAPTVPAAPVAQAAPAAAAPAAPTLAATADTQTLSPTSLANRRVAAQQGGVRYRQYLSQMGSPAAVAPAVVAAPAVPMAAPPRPMPVGPPPQPVVPAGNREAVSAAPTTPVTAAPRPISVEPPAQPVVQTSNHEVVSTPAPLAVASAPRPLPVEPPPQPVVLTSNREVLSTPAPMAVAVAPRPEPVSSVPQQVIPTAAPATPVYNAVPARPSPVTQVLQQRIAKACAGQARDVEIIPVSDSSMTVRMKVRNAAAGQQVGRAVLNLPELTPYQVKLEVQIVP